MPNVYATPVFFTGRTYINRRNIVYDMEEKNLTTQEKQIKIFTNRDTVNLKVSADKDGNPLNQL